MSYLNTAMHRHILCLVSLAACVLHESYAVMHCLTCVLPHAVYSRLVDLGILPESYDMDHLRSCGQSTWGCPEFGVTAGWHTDIYCTLCQHRAGFPALLYWLVCAYFCRLLLVFQGCDCNCSTVPQLSVQVDVAGLVTMLVSSRMTCLSFIVCCSSVICLSRGVDCTNSARSHIS